jgi:hypothetical protein
LFLFVDHSQIDYPEIEKFFYEEHPDIANLSKERVDQIRKELGNLSAFINFMVFYKNNT